MKFSLHSVVWATAAVAAVHCLPAEAQQRRPNPGSQTFLHEWPMSGVWQAALTRLAPEGNLGCIVVTGYHNVQTGERYLWGLRRQAQQAAVAIIDSNAGAVEGSEIKVVVDGAVVGSFPITARVARSGFRTIRSDLSSKDAGVIENLMSVGGNIEFSTENATYSASLAGARTAMQNFYACMVEASQINSAQDQ